MTVTRTIRLFESDSYQRVAEAQVVEVVEEGIYLDRTIFYAESGGQPGDTGVLTTADAKAVQVHDAVYTDDKQRILHKTARAADVRPGDRVQAAIDWERRYRHMQMHSLLHLVCGLVDAPVTGCAIHADRGRLDFDLPDNTLDKTSLTDTINELIARNLPVEALNLQESEIDLHRPLARTVGVAPPRDDTSLRMIKIPGVDIQPCGGTHVAKTGEIEEVLVTKIEKKSRHNRRVTISFAKT
jgi:misacylated tRNA(Ala) deacylase